MTSHNQFRRQLMTTAFGVSLAFLAAAGASAQAAPTAGADKASTVEEVVVTATGTSIRGVEAVGSETVKLDRAQMLSTGLNNPVEVLRTVPQIQNLGFDQAPHSAQNGGGNIQRGTAISLRGLSSNATLVLIDGHRIAPTGNVFSFTEANQLPVSVIQQIDVVADGASAIYGSDAVAGVVNFIPRKNFDGFEVSARYRTNKYYDETGGAILGGHSWTSLMGLGGGHIVGAYDYDSQGDMLRGATPYLRQDLRAFGGNDGRISNNVATVGPGGAIVVAGAKNTTLPSAGNFTYYGIPLTGTPTAANLLVNQPNLLDTADYTDFIPSQKRQQAFLYLDQDLTPAITVYYEGYYDQRRSDLRNGSGALSSNGANVRSLPATSPFYIAGVPGVAAGAPETVAFSFLNAIGGTTLQHINDDSLANTVGIRVKLPKDWTGEGSFTNSFDRLCANCIDPGQANINAAVLQAELNNGNLNPFSTTPISAAELAKFTPGGYDQSRSILDDTVLKFDGPLWDMPGGTLRAAVGAEYQHITGARTSRGIQATSDTIGAAAERNVTSFYGEVFVPIIGSGNALPLVQRLLVDAAVRTEKYSDFGRTTNPKIGLTWEVNDDLTLRAAWGKSFRAPNLVENNPAFFSSVSLAARPNAANDPTIPVTNAATGTTNAVTVAGSNKDLTPEKATNYSFGFDFRPHALPGLELTGTYYNIDYTNQIIGLQTAVATFLANPANRALYSAYIVAAKQPAGCVNGQPSTYNPLYLTVLARPTLTPVDQSNFCSSGAILYSQNTNAATTKQDGLDFTASYRFETGFGAWTPAIGGTKILNNRQALAPGAPLTDALDTINNPNSLRYRASLTWNMGPWTASAVANYIGAYTNNLPITVSGVLQPVTKVDAWPTGDLSLAYTVPAGDTSWASGVRASVTVINFTDRKPPTVLSANGGAFDDQSANIFGRQVSVQLSKKF